MTELNLQYYFTSTPHHHREFLAPFGKTTFTPLPLCPRASDWIYTIRVRVYFIYGFAIYKQTMKTGRMVGRPRGIAAPLTRVEGEKGTRTKFPLRRDIPMRWARCSTFEASEIKMVKKKTCPAIIFHSAARHEHSDIVTSMRAF